MWFSINICVDLDNIQKTFTPRPKPSNAAQVFFLGSKVKANIWRDEKAYEKFLPRDFTKIQNYKVSS